MTLTLLSGVKQRMLGAGGSSWGSTSWSAQRPQRGYSRWRGSTDTRTSVTRLTASWTTTSPWWRLPQTSTRRTSSATPACRASRPASTRDTTAGSQAGETPGVSGGKRGGVKSLEEAGRDIDPIRNRIVCCKTQPRQKIFILWLKMQFKWFNCMNTFQAGRRTSLWQKPWIKHACPSSTSRPAGRRNSGANASETPWSAPGSGTKRTRLLRARSDKQPKQYYHV